jgi:hypothetical protein
VSDEGEIKINIEELQILLNLIGKEVRIRYPLYNFNFLLAREHESGYDITITCTERDFDKELAHFGNQRKELPVYSDLRAGLLSAGVMKYENFDEFGEKLKSYRNLNKDIKFSLDTNMLYFRFTTNYRLIKPSEIVLVETVGDEIKAKLNYKYNPNTLAAIKKSAKVQKQLLDELWNRRMKRSRKAAYIALREYKMLLDGVADELEEVKQSSADSRDNDMIIVKTLTHLAAEGHTFPILITADDSMADLCNAEGLEYFKFDLPHLIDADYCTAKPLMGLIFNLAVVFGFIKINSVIIFGEFRGKSSNYPDELKLEFQNEKLQHDFERDLRICRKLMKLGIEK